MPTTMSQQVRQAKKRSGPAAQIGGGLVLVVHGFWSTHHANFRLNRHLREAGFVPQDVRLPGLNTQDLRLSSQCLARAVETAVAAHPQTPLQLIGISMGGLIALHYLRTTPGPVVTRLVTLATPFYGAPPASRWARLARLALPAVPQIAPGSEFLAHLHAQPHPETAIVSIAARGDTLVPPDATRLPGAYHLDAPQTRWPFGHYEIILRRANLEVVAAALAGKYDAT